MDGGDVEVFLFDASCSCPIVMMLSDAPVSNNAQEAFFAPMVTLWRLTCHSTRLTPCDFDIGGCRRIVGVWVACAAFLCQVAWFSTTLAAKWVQVHGTPLLCGLSFHNVCRCSSSSLLSWSSVSATFASPLIFAELHNGHSGTRCLFEFIKGSC